MIKKNTIAGICLLAAAGLLLAACSAPQTTTAAAPTVDANLIYTQAAQTVQAGLDQTRQAAPPVVATNTPQPTFTMDPVIAAGLTATANAVLNPAAATPTGPTPTGPTPTGQALTIPTATLNPLLPTATRGAVQKPPANTADKCEWVSNSPADNSNIPRKASFDATIRVKNSGTTTWDTRYALRYFAGERMGVPSDFYVQRQVKPNETYDFLFTMKAPDSTGKKEVLIAVQNPDGYTMCFVNIPLNITD